MPKYLLLDLKESFRVENAWMYDADSLDQKTGSNTGNFAFRYSIINFLLANDIDIVLGGFDSLENIVEYDAVILACSNWLGVSDEHEGLNKSRMESLLKVDLPVLAIGLGTQMHYEQSSSDLRPHTREFLSVLKSKSISISVRDDFTANILRDLGFLNIYTTGCPSNFISPKINLGSTICEKLQQIINCNSWQGIYTAVQEYSGKSPYSSDVFSHHYKFFSTFPSQYFVQDFPLIRALLKFPFELPNEYNQNHFGLISDVLPDVYVSEIRNKSIFFTDFPAWMSHLRRFDLSFGMRLHGNMAAVQVGVPSAVIAHDLRTKELSNLMSIPSINPKDFIEMNFLTPSTISQFMLPFFQKYDATRANLAEKMIACLSVSGISPSTQLLSLGSLNQNK